MKDEPRKPLNVFAVDEKMNRATGSIPYTSLRWVRRYCKPGEFEMVVPANIYDPSWAYIVCDDRPETGIIQKVEFTDSSQVYGGIDSVTVSGFFLESILNNIVFLQESPEQEKVYVPKPRRPVGMKSQSPDVYQDPAGGYWVELSTGQLQDVVTGALIDGATDDMTAVDYNSAYHDNNWGTGTAYMRYDYWSDDSHESVTRVDSDGTQTTYDVVFADDRGNAFYRDEGGKLTQATGIVSSAGGTYTMKTKTWQALPDDDPYGRYYLKTVQGPWQRTEMMEPVTVGDSIQIVMKWARRMMGDWITYEEPDIEGVQKSVDPSFQYLGDLLYATLYEVGASLRLEYVFESNAYVLSVYRGADRTQAQTDMPWAVFSDTWGTLTGYSASRDTSNYRNTCFVLYEYDRPNSFDANGWPHAGPIYAIDDTFRASLYGIAYTRMAGYNTEHVGDDTEPAIETYLDIRSEKPSCDSAWSREVTQLDTSSDAAYEKSKQEAAAKYAYSGDGSPDLKSIYDAYEAAIPGRGEAHLKENYFVETQLDTGTVRTNGYLRDFDLGDLVEMAVSTVGLATQARIIEVEESYTSGNVDIRLTIGDEKLTTIKKARLA